MAGAYQGVILAAGHGSRLGPFGEQSPKPIVPICNRPLLAYQLESLRNLGIEDVTIVIGHLGHLITRAIGDGAAYGVRIRYVEQQKRLGIAHALGQLEPHIDKPFMLMLGDIYFSVPRLHDMLKEREQFGAAAVLAVKNEEDPAAIKRNFAVLLRDDGTVRRVIEKPRHTPNSLKGCGLYLFDLTIFDAIRRTPRTALRDEYELTEAIQILVNDDCSVRISPVVDWDINITYLNDLIPCSLHQLEQRGLSKLVGEGAHVDADAVLEQTVVGDHARIDAPVTMSRCVVLPHAIVSTPGAYQDKVFLPPSPLFNGARVEE